MSEEEYGKLRKQLKQMIARKNKIDRELDNTEEKIFVEESNYLHSATGGNVIRGFENYTKSNQNRRKLAVVETDRVFSKSSALEFEE